MNPTKRHIICSAVKCSERLQLQSPLQLHHISAFLDVIADNKDH
jgi:hypothetical protein